MSKIGTCLHCHQIQHLVVVDLYGMRTESQPEVYMCQWLDCVVPKEELPPVIKRANGGFLLNADDCDSCAQWTPASNWQGKKVT